MRRLPLVVLLALVPIGFLGALTWASPPSLVTPTAIARATFPAFDVESDRHGPVAFRARAKRPVDMFIRQQDYALGGHTGWHSHPGPVFMQVTKGTLTVYEYADRRCRPLTLTVGQGYVDTGRGHMVRNESSEPAQDVSVIMAPTDNGAFRGELDAPNPRCRF